MNERQEGLELALDPQSGMERSPFAGNGEIQLKEHDHRQSYDYLPPGGQPQPRKSRICGLARRTFWLALAIAILLICVAVAAGVGGSIAASRSHSSPSTQPSSSPTPTTSNTTHPSSAPQSTATSSPLACPSSNATQYISPIGGSWDIICGFDFPANGTNQTNGIDLFSLKATSLEGCIDACASWTAIGVEGGPCLIATWVEIFQSCYLKNSTSLPAKLSLSSDPIDSAVLSPNRG